MALQGVRYVSLEVLNAGGLPVPSDGITMGEVAMRGNVVMKGYLKDPEATNKAFAGEWFRTGDRAVRHVDGYVQLRNRSKDIIISGGENVSSIEVEETLYGTRPWRWPPSWRWRTRNGAKCHAPSWSYGQAWTWTRKR